MLTIYQHLSGQVIQNVGSELSSISKDSHMYRVVLHTMSGYCFLPTWRVKTGKSGHKTVLDALVCAQRCKISDTRIIQPVSTSLNMPSAENIRNQTQPTSNIVKTLQRFSPQQVHFGRGIPPPPPTTCCACTIVIPHLELLSYDNNNHIIFRTTDNANVC